MKFTAAAALALAATAFAAPIEERDSTPYTLHATQTNSNGLLDKQIHANGYALWVNKATESYCPSSSVGAANCPPGNVTSFVASSMNVEVPGGQALYIGPNGKVGYTVPHSSSVPTGSVTTGIKKILTTGDRTWLCNKKASSNAYALWVAVNSTALPYPAGDQTCAKATLVAKNIAAGVSAWEYE